METTMEVLAPYLRGWRSYFGFCETPCWRWGFSPRLARNTAGSGHGPWYLARSPALARGPSNAYFRSFGLPSLIEER
jgi:RNA-directed DNA polymerase